MREGMGTVHRALNCYSVEKELWPWETPVSKAAEVICSLWDDSPEEPDLWSPGPTLGLEMARNPVQCCFCGFC